MQSVCASLDDCKTDKFILVRQGNELFAIAAGLHTHMANAKLAPLTTDQVRDTLDQFLDTTASLVAYGSTLGYRIAYAGCRAPTSSQSIVAPPSASQRSIERRYAFRSRSLNCNKNAGDPQHASCASLGRGRFFSIWCPSCYAMERHNGKPPPLVTASIPRH